MNAAEAEDVDVVAWNCQVKRVRGKRFNGKFNLPVDVPIAVTEALAVAAASSSDPNGSSTNTLAVAIPS
jgi:hypothetical protein